MAQSNLDSSKEVEVTDGKVCLAGYLTQPKDCLGIVIFAHGSGSSRLSPRNMQVAQSLNRAGLGTLLFDLLTVNEAQDRDNVFDIPLLSSRLVTATKWIQSLWQGKKRGGSLPISYFGASTGGAAALWAAADMGSEISAVVSRGGRPDLAIPRLKEVIIPVLLIVGGHDEPVIDMNRQALRYLKNGSLVIVPGATHLFEEPGTLEVVSEHARTWFTRHFSRAGQKGSLGPAA